MRGTVEKYNASWRIRYEVGIKADGRRDQRSKAGFKTRRDAEAALTEALERVRRGDVFDARRVMVGEFLDSWLASKRNIRPTTERAYAGHIRVYLKPLIGAVPLSALRANISTGCTRQSAPGNFDAHPDRLPSAASTRPCARRCKVPTGDG
jgi:hypothetical protein